MQDFEQLGAFYLGRIFDPAANHTTQENLLYDSKDLTTHAMCVGMTGSGKTGLCVSLLEEAAIDGIPAVVIDPKGDLGNLMLNFPQLRPQDFRPWVDESEALRKGQTPDAFAEATSALWKKGLADWGQGPERLRRLRDSADVSIYTPGSSAGLSLTVLKSFDAPADEILNDADALRDRIAATVSGLLALLGVNADPLQSREHILVSNILNHTWQRGENLDLPGMIRAIQEPPFKKLGVFDLESFYPASDRMSLAMRLNNMLASPGFASWTEGEPLDFGRLLYTPEGKPRISILSIAHLSESERMFFVTLVLNEALAWMRAQPGTSSLRALLYMDEIFGYFPPSGNPPSKQPMLTLLKQARAFGLGCVLATQNPVDLDYKGLGNTGTWLIGRLQTERDKLRILDGLEGATAGAGKAFDRARIETILSGLGKRVFLMNNVHEDEPVLFQTRWAMSYLRGPLTRTQIETLMAPRKKVQTKTLEQEAIEASPVPETLAAEKPKAQESSRPKAPAGITEVFYPTARDVPETHRLVYRPALFAPVTLHFVKASVKVDTWQQTFLNGIVPTSGTVADWSQAKDLKTDRTPAFQKKPEADASFEPLPEPAGNARNFTSWEKQLASFLYQSHTLTILKSTELKLYSEPGESEGDFRVRLKQAAHEQRDLDMEKLRATFAPRLERLKERLRKAEAKVEIQEEQYKQSKLSGMVSIGTTLLGALLGRKAMSVGTARRAGSSMRSIGRAGKEKEDIRRAMEDMQSIQQQLEDMEKQFAQETEKLKTAYDPMTEELQEIPVRPRKSDITAGPIQLAWTPWSVSGSGIAEPLF